MSGADLTRWNRAGLGRFEYIDGNAATFLEDIRKALKEHFSWTGWADIAGPTLQELLREDGDGKLRLARIEEQYGAETATIAWEQARALARACHVLTEHIGAYANEGFLGTATQWDSVRKLVGLLGYHPSPPASASTCLAIEAGEGLSGTLEAGFQVSCSPPDGGAPLVFETLEDLDVSAGLNALRIAGHDRSPRALQGDSLALDDVYEDLRVGDPVVLEDVSRAGGRLEARVIESFRTDGGRTIVKLHDPIPLRAGYTEGGTVVHLKPLDRLDPLGPAALGATIKESIQLKEAPDGLRAGEVVYVSDGSHEYYRRVAAVRGRCLVFHEPLGALHLDGAWVSRARLLSVAGQGGRAANLYAVKVAGDHSRLAGHAVADVTDRGLTSFRIEDDRVFAAAYQPVDVRYPENGGYTTLRISDPKRALGNPQAILVPPEARDWDVDSFLAGDNGQPLPAALVTGQPKQAAAGDVAVVLRGRQLAWSRIESVTLDEERAETTLSMGRWSHRGGGLYYLAETKVLAHFQVQARLAGWDHNEERLSGSSLALEVQTPPAGLEPGRTVFVDRDDGPGDAGFQPVQAKVTGVASTGEWVELSLDRAIDQAQGYTCANTVVRANVVQAGHGEQRPERVLGSGDAARSSQSFVLDVQDVSFVADAAQPNGVAAAIRLTVDGRAWTQVGSMQDSGPADCHYTVRMTEGGRLHIEFGDGRNGRRLPTGANNVRVAFRQGTGLAGTGLPPGSLEKPVHPHYLVKAVLQPLATTGGNDMEDAGSMRENAPASILALERAVSLADFAGLASRHSSVWQARAFAQGWGRGRSRKLLVVVVPAGGGSELGDLRGTLQAYLQACSVPGVAVEVAAYDPVPVHLDVTLKVDEDAYDPSSVEAVVRSSLFAAFSLDRRRLGQPLYRSEVYRVVESVEGVAWSDCGLRHETAAGPGVTVSVRTGPGGAVRVIRAGGKQVCYLDEDLSKLDIRTEAYVP